MRRNGFTIVELLIVIVVIGVLAAITIVAFNGIQNRANSSAAASAAAQAKKKLMAYGVENGSYPASANLADAGIQDLQGTSYQYSSTGAGFCLTATKGNASHKVTESSSPSAGGCAGHGQGGASAVTNLALNPSFETAPVSNTYGPVTRTNPTVGDAFAGTRVTRVTRSDTTNSGIWWDTATPISENTAYTACVYVRGTDQASRSVRIEWINAAGNTNMGVSTLQTISPMPSSWTRYCGSATSPAGSGRLRLTLYGSGGVAGTYFDTDAVMVTQGTTEYPYGDGDSTDWVWNGTAHNATSTGPAQ